MPSDHSTQLKVLDALAKLGIAMNMRTAHGLRTETEGPHAGKMISYVEISVVADA